MGIWKGRVAKASHRMKVVALRRKVCFAEVESLREGRSVATEVGS